jgi:alpha-N-arabinofuranosidase
MTAVKFVLTAFLTLLSLTCAHAEESVITVSCSKTAGSVNPLVFGTNFIGYDPATYEDCAPGYTYYGYSDFGAGIWDPAAQKPVENVCGLAREAGVTIARFPGGCGSHKYDWKLAVGRGRKHFLYGIDEFMASCEAIGCQAV